MARATWLADVLRAEGLHVVEMAGWETRETRTGFQVNALVWHHTATGKNWTDENVRRLLRDGRPDLPGPLSQLGLERDGTYVCVAAGRCSHNGYGLYGNDSIGIEAYNDGLGEPWARAQVDAFHRGSAAICRHAGLDPMTRLLAHRETDPRRKVDPAGLDMDAARRTVAALLATAPPIASEEDDTMTFVHVTDSGRYYMVTAKGVTSLTAAEAKQLKADGWQPRKMLLATWNKVT